MLGMVMALLGGCWYPIELFPRRPDRRQGAAHHLGHAGHARYRAAGQGLIGVLLPAAVLLGFAAVFFVIGVWRFRYE